MNHLKTKHNSQTKINKIDAYLMRNKVNNDLRYFSIFKSTLYRGLMFLFSRELKSSDEISVVIEENRETGYVPLMPQPMKTESSINFSAFTANKIEQRYVIASWWFHCTLGIIQNQKCLTGFICVYCKYLVTRVDCLIHLR